MSELDELLLEHDELLTPIDKDSAFLNKLPGGDDSFDIENSDELNTIIDKYENTLDKRSPSDLALNQEMLLSKIASANDSFDDGIADDLDMVEREVNSGRTSSSQ